MDQHTLRLLRAQQDRCPACEELLVDPGQEPQSPQQWEQWFMAARRTMRKQLVVCQADNASGERSFYRLLHAHCYRLQQAGHT